MYGAIFLLLLVAGCSTPHDLRKTKPKISYVTTRPAKKVMECIRDKWREHQTTVYEQKTSDGWVIRHDDVLPAATVAIVEISGTEPEVHVDYYHRTNRVKLHRLEEEIVDCKE
jgi:hypothetical protein